MLIPLWTSDFRNTATLMPTVAIMGRPIPLNKAIGPGIIPIPNIGGSLGMSTKPAMIITRYKAKTNNWSLHSIRFNTFITHLTVGRPVTQRPPHRPGRAVFLHPVPRLYSLPRKTLVYANIRCCRLTTCIFGLAIFRRSMALLNTCQVKLLRFPPRRLSHLNGHSAVQK